MHPTITARYSNIWRMIAAECPQSLRARASNHFEWLDPRHPESWPQRVVLYCRVSGRDQEWRNGLRKQIVWMKAELRRREIKVVAVYWDVRSGWNTDKRVGLDLAIQAALRHGVPIVAESTCRLLRSSDYHSADAPHAVPTVFEFERFMAGAKGVSFATLVDPDADLHDVRSHQSVRGYRVCTTPGEKKLWRATVGAKAVLLWLEGWSYRKVATETCTPTATVQGWIRAFVRGVWNS